MTSAPANHALIELQQRLCACAEAIERLRRGSSARVLPLWLALTGEQLAVRKLFIHRLASLLTEPIGLQAKTRSGTVLLLTGSAQKPKHYQLTRFDASGQPWGDTNYARLPDALEELVQESDISSITDLATQLLGPELEPLAQAEPTSVRMRP